MIVGHPRLYLPRMTHDHGLPPYAVAVGVARQPTLGAWPGSNNSMPDSPAAR